MRRRLLTPAILLLSLTACSTEKDASESLPSASYESTTSSSEASTSSEATTASPTSAPPTTPAKTARGNVAKQIGEVGGMFSSDPANLDVFQFVVTSIEPGYECAGTYSQPSENGQFIAVRMSITTGPNLFDITYGVPLTLSSYDFQVIAPDGVQENNVASIPTFSCLPDNEVFPPTGMGPGVSANVAFVVDTKATSGIIIFKPSQTGGTAGWEYSF